MNFSLNLLTALTIFVSSLAFASDNNGNTVRYLDLEVSNLVLTSQTNSGKVVYAEPGEQIIGQANCINYRPSYNLEYNQAIVGFDGIGAQDGIGYGPFILVAPMTPGIYEVRFRYAQAYSLNDAIKNWWWVDGAPNDHATIGLVIVAEYAETIPHELNDDNWQEWLQEKYSFKNHFADDILIHSTLTNKELVEKDFWDTTKIKGHWKLHENGLCNNGTLHYNQHNKLVSQNAYQNFFIQITEEYKHTKNNATDWWSHSRGFGIHYYMTDDRNVEFRYFADIGQLSLYIRDENRFVELIKKAYFPPETKIVHDIIIDNGVILWQVNNEVIFAEKTTLKQGYFMLSNHNNAVSFTF